MLKLIETIGANEYFLIQYRILIVLSKNRIVPLASPITKELKVIK